jgi:hypothetical protein
MTHLLEAVVSEAVATLCFPNEGPVARNGDFLRISMFTRRVLCYGGAPTGACRSARTSIAPTVAAFALRKP